MYCKRFVATSKSNEVSVCISACAQTKLCSISMQTKSAKQAKTGAPFTAYINWYYNFSILICTWVLISDSVWDVPLNSTRWYVLICFEFFVWYACIPKWETILTRKDILCRYNISFQMAGKILCCMHHCHVWHTSCILSLYVYVEWVAYFELVSTALPFTMCAGFLHVLEDRS